MSMQCSTCDRSLFVPKSLGEKLGPPAPLSAMPGGACYLCNGHVDAALQGWHRSRRLATITLGGVLGFYLLTPLSAKWARGLVGGALGYLVYDQGIKPKVTAWHQEHYKGQLPKAAEKLSLPQNHRAVVFCVPSDAPPYDSIKLFIKDSDTFQKLTLTMKGDTLYLLQGGTPLPLEERLSKPVNGWTPVEFYANGTKLEWFAKTGITYKPVHFRAGNKEGTLYEIDGTVFRLGYTIDPRLAISKT